MKALVKRADHDVQGRGQTRSFSYVDELVAELRRRCADRPVNIGNPRDFTVRDLTTW
jgi:nucleoside-diphosphate-sugar epimerase